MPAAIVRVGFWSCEMPLILHLFSTLHGWSTWFSSSNKSLITHCRAFKKGCNLNLSRYQTPIYLALTLPLMKGLEGFFPLLLTSQGHHLLCPKLWVVRRPWKNLQHILPDNRTQTANPFGLGISRCCFRSHWRWSFGTGPQNTCSNPQMPGVLFLEGLRTNIGNKKHVTKSLNPSSNLLFLNLK